MSETEMVTVHYVIGDDPKTGQRRELAKFFAAIHAEAHAKTLRHHFHNVSIEVREETRISQHHAHGGSAQ